MNENFMNMDFSKLLGNAEKMRKEMEEIKKSLAEATVVGDAGGGMARVVMSGERKVLRVEFSAESLRDRAMLQDLTAAAIADALAKVEEAQRDAMRSSLLGAFGASP